MKTATMNRKSKAFHDSIATMIDSFPDGTYDIETLESVEFSKGFQVTFCQVGDNYSPEQYEMIVNLFLELSMDSRIYAGKFDGTAEISFRFANKKLAKQYAKAFNQISIWDWKHSKLIETYGTGKRQ